MYSEQMMREQGFDDAPNFRLNMYTDAIWRACRIILDVRMHRGEIGVDEAIRFMVEQTSFEEPNARAEVLRYTYTPTYQLSYLLGKVLLLQLRADERGRLGAGLLAQGASTTRCCATAACRSASSAGSWPAEAARAHRRRLGRRPRGRALTRAGAGHPGDRPRGRALAGRLWPGASAGVGAPTDRPERIAARFVEQGARIVHLVDFDGARAGAPANLEAIGSVAASGRRPAPGRRRAGDRRRDPARLRRGCDPGRPGDVGRRRPGPAARLPRGRRRLAGGRSRPAPRAAGGLPVEAARRPPTLEALVGELVGRGRPPARPRPRPAGPDLRSAGSARSVVRRRHPRRRWSHATRPRSRASATPAWPASSSESRSCPEPSTSPPPWRLPHDPSSIPASRPTGRSARSARRRPARRRLHRTRRRLGRRRSSRRPRRPARPGRARRAVRGGGTGSAARRRGRPVRLPDEPARAAARPARRGPSRSTRPRARSSSRSTGRCRRSPPATSSRWPSAAGTTASSSTGSSPASSSRAATASSAGSAPTASWPTRDGRSAARATRSRTSRSPRSTAVAWSRWPGRTPRLGRVAVLHRPRRSGW